MIKSRAVLAGSLLVFAGAASAEIAITPTLASDYDYRGISQTGDDPAFQLGVTYTGETGMYLGLWGSNVQYTVTPGEAPAKVEIDTYAGYAGGDAKEGWGYDVGAIYYSYPNQGSANYPEFYTGVSKGVFSAKLWYSWNMYNSGDTSYYADVNLNMPASDVFSVLFHIGYSGGEFWTADKPGRPGKYMDWSLGFGATVKGATMAVKYVDGSDLNVNFPRNLGRIIFSLSTTLSTAD
jgi:uncharacterized protein (TIGR02001 family)